MVSIYKDGNAVGGPIKTVDVTNSLGLQAVANAVMRPMDTLD
jgi:hypothetical protein